MKDKVPRVAPESKNIFDSFADGFSGAFEFLGNFLTNFGLWLFVLLVIAGILIFIWRKLSQRRAQIEKLWVYILFFLTKRQMLIPLVISLSKKDNHLDSDVQSALLEIREQCRNVSLKKSPRERMELEEQVSEILFIYFSNLEKEGTIKPGTKFEKIVKDLEFIDAKLVQLQKVYNHEVIRWNKLVNFPVSSLILRLMQFDPFQKFTTK